MGHLPLKKVLPILFIYLVISAIGVFHHEFGLEEAQQFLIGRDSSLSSLYYNMRYEGHPRLWCFLLYFLTHYITAGYVGLQVFHWLITGAIVFILLRYAPFGLFFKVLIIFGYYFLFEYDLLARSYSLGILFLFITCLLLNDPQRHLSGIGWMLVLLCNTDLFYAFAAAGIFLYLVMDYAGQKKLATGPFYLLTALFLLGMACTLIQAQIPREDYVLQTHAADWLSKKNLSSGLFALIRGWLPIPLTLTHFWNTWWMNEQHIPAAFGILLFGFLLLFPGLMLKNNKKALVFYYTSLFLLLSLLVVTRLGATRYYGMVYIYFLAACWIAGNGRGDFFAGRKAGDPSRLRVFLLGTFGTILAVQLVIGVYALEQDLVHPFSASKDTIAYIDEKGLAGEDMVVDGYVSGPALSLYLGKKIFYLDTGKEGSFCYWQKPYFPAIRRTVEQEMIRSPFLDKFDRFILVSNRKLEVDSIRARGRDFQLTALQAFGNSIIMGEEHYVYQVQSFDPSGVRRQN